MPLNRNLRLSVMDGGFYSFMVGLGETYIAAYMLAKGYSAIAASLISTVPLLIGGLLQLLTPLLLPKMGSYKRWVVKTSFIQGLSLLILANTAFFEISVYWVFLIVSLYWAGGMSTGPAWNSWMTELVPADIQIRYFSFRSTVSSAFVFLGLVLGGILLHQKQADSSELLQMFFNIFAIAAICRFISSFFLSQQTETELSRKTILNQSIHNVFKSAFHQKNLLLFIFVFLLGVHFSSCFFNPFMLKELRLDFSNYMLLLASSFLAKMASQSISHKLITKLSLQRVFLLSVLGIVPLPLIWIFDQSFYYLFCMQFVSGFMWGLYEVCIFLTLFSGVSTEKRTATLSVYNLFQTSAMVFGSTIGAIVFNNVDSNAYYSVFAISTALRFISVAFFPGFKMKPVDVKSLFVIKPSGERLSRGEVPQIIIEETHIHEVKKSKRSVS